MLIYIHVPFCRKRCSYCAFHAEALWRRSAAEQTEVLRTYAETLAREVELWAHHLGKRAVRTIFFGGGTPSLLSPDAVGSLLDTVRSSFSVDPRAEITLEANPESLRGTRVLSDYRSVGITRLSLGAQSFDPEMLRVLGRIHKVEDLKTAYAAAREAGFVNIGLDLMWGLPNQSIRHWLKTLKAVVALAPEHISTYGLTLEPGTRLDQEFRAGRFALPNEQEQRVMFLEGAALLEKHGYMQYEISNYAKMGFQCRHNIGYWEGEEYVGLGPSATSTLGMSRFTNPASHAEWAAKIAAENVGGEEERLTPLISVLEMIMLRLRTSRGLSLDRYKAMTGHDFLVDHGKMVQALYENGLIRIRNKFLRLTLPGMLVSNSILSNLFEQTKRVLQRALPAQDSGEWASLTRAGQTSKKQAVSRVVWPRA